MSLTWFTSEVVKCTQLIDALSGAFLLEMVQEEFKREIESEKYIHLMSKTVQSYDWQKTSWNQRQDYLRREYVDSHLSYLYWMAKWQSKSPQWNPRILPLKGWAVWRNNSYIVYKGHIILVPPRLCSDTLNYTCPTTRDNLEKTKRLARQCIFWMGMSAQIEDAVGKCANCLWHCNANSRELLLPHQIPLHACGGESAPTFLTGRGLPT